MKRTFVFCLILFALMFAFPFQEEILANGLNTNKKFESSLSKEEISSFIDNADTDILGSPESHADFSDFERSPLRAGATEAFLDLPLGVPLSGYTGRFFTHAPDGRESPYTTRFAPSVGAQTRSSLKAIVVENQEEIVVFLRLELIYVADVLLFAIEDEISERLGIDLHDKLIIVASHTHSGYGNFWNNWILYLGHDMYIPEIFHRMVAQSADAIEDAYYSLQPARAGIGFDKNFDPRDRIFSDRRDHNDVLGPNGELIWGNGGKRIRHDLEPRGKSKDNRLTIFRIDDLAGDPIAAMIHFGMHSTILEERNLFLSGDAVFHVEWFFQETFDQPVVSMFLPGAGGDISPRGNGFNFKDFQLLERLGRIAAPKIRQLFDSVETTSEADIEIVSRQVPQSREDIRIVRDGKEISYGTPKFPCQIDDDYFFTYDDFNFSYGAGMCGSTCDENPETIKGEGYDNVYLSCIDSVTAGKVIPPSFRLPPQQLPLAEYSTRITAIRFNEYLLVTLPGEPMSILSDKLRKLVPPPFDFDHTIVIGYAQDHEGYLHTRFDWLQGRGAEVVNFWGPLHGEYLMDQSLDLAHQLTTLEKEAPGGIDRPQYRNEVTWKSDPIKPEITLNAGKVYKDYQFIGEDILKQIQRFENATFTWLGGDPTIDWPVITLQKEDENGDFQDALLPSGRKLTDAGPDMFLRYNPYPIDIVFREREHRWTVDWETLKNTEVGIYRFHVSGYFFDGSEHYP